MYNFKDDLLNKVRVQFHLKDLKSESTWKICVCIMTDAIWEKQGQYTKMTALNDTSDLKRSEDEVPR